MSGDTEMPSELPNEKPGEAVWPQKVWFQLGVVVAAHPIEYAKVLMQIGYEPLPPRPTRTLFGRPALGLPNIFQYIGYIKKRTGFFGLYHGISARLCGSVIHNQVLTHITKIGPLKSEIATEGEDESDGDAVSDEDKVLVFFQKTARDLIAQCAAVIASHPFQVITVRMISQFVGEEQTYNGLLQSIREIYKSEGISGFFNGLAPRLLGELLSLWLASCLTFAINTYIVKDVDLRSYIAPSMSFIAVAATYPFILVSKVMCVNNSGLVAGKPPHMPIYTSWTDCWTHLKAQNQLKRGSSILWRYYTGPYILREGKPVIADLKDFRVPSRTKLE